jgi:hypothetical protein
MAKSLFSKSQSTYNLEVETPRVELLNLNTSPMFIETEAFPFDQIWNFAQNTTVDLDHVGLFTDFEGDEEMLRSYLGRSGKYLMANFDDIQLAIGNHDFSLALRGGNRMLSIASTLRAASLVKMINHLKSLIVDEKPLECHAHLEDLRKQIQETNKVLLGILSTL